MLLGLFGDGAEQRAESRAEHGVAAAGMVGPAVARIRRLIESPSQQGVQPIPIAISHNRLPSANL